MRRKPLYLFLMVSLLLINLNCGGGSGGGVAEILAPASGNSPDETSGGTDSPPTGTAPGETSPGTPDDSSGGTTGEPGNETEGTIHLAWDSNTDQDLTGYFVYYGTSSGVYQHSIDIGMATPGSGDMTTHTLTGLVKGQKYYIAVTAYDTSNFQSGFSNEVNGVAG